MEHWNTTQQTQPTHVLWLHICSWRSKRGQSRTMTISHLDSWESVGLDNFQLFSPRAAQEHTGPVLQNQSAYWAESGLIVQQCCTHNLKIGKVVPVSKWHLVLCYRILEVRGSRLLTTRFRRTSLDFEGSDKQAWWRLCLNRAPAHNSFLNLL